MKYTFHSFRRAHHVTKYHIFQLADFKLYSKKVQNFQNILKNLYSEWNLKFTFLFDPKIIVSRGEWGHLRSNIINFGYKFNFKAGFLAYCCMINESRLIETEPMLVEWSNHPYCDSSALVNHQDSCKFMFLMLKCEKIKNLKFRQFF